MPVLLWYFPYIIFSAVYDLAFSKKDTSSKSKRLEIDSFHGTK